MLRTIFTPDSNHVNVFIPDIYIGMELEVLVSPINTVSTVKAENKISAVDTSFGGWADMDKTTEDICTEIRSDRVFRNRDFNFV